MSINDRKAFAKKARYEALGHVCKLHQQGVIIDGLVMVNKMANKWKFLGSPDWYRFRYSKDLSQAIKTDTLGAFAEQCAGKTVISKHWDKEQRDEYFTKRPVPPEDRSFLDKVYYENTVSKS